MDGMMGGREAREELLKLRQMGTQRVHMKGVLGLDVPAQEIFVLP
jgi:hypothetical protein